MHGRSALIVACGLCLAFSPMGGGRVWAKGKIKGSTGGNERDAMVFDALGKRVGWTITGPSGLYEFGDLEAGEYMVQVAGHIVPRVLVRDGETTVVNQADQPKLDLEKELWGPARVRFAQSFVATGTAITGFALWRPSGNSKLVVSLYEDSPSGKRIAGPHETAGEMTWICWAPLPADEFLVTPGKRYALEFACAEGKPWNIAAPRIGDVYPEGIAYYDGVAHAESDLGVDIEQASPGLKAVSARDDQHFIAEGPGSGLCRVAGQTFIAKAPNVIRAGANCGGFGGGVKDFIFSFHEEGPGGKQVGPAGEVRMVSDWGSDVLWFPDAVRLTPGKQYYLQYRREDGGPFYSYLSSDECKPGRAYRDGKLLPEQFDQYFSILGEEEPESVIFPYNVTVKEVSATSATVAWRTGTVGDGLVHFGTMVHLTEQAGSESSRANDHEVVLTNLDPGTMYMYRVSSHTHKRSSKRVYSRIRSFLTLPGGEDRPRFDKPAGPASPEVFDNVVAVVNPGFEDGLEGWSRKSRAGREKEPERFRPDCEPFGDVTPGQDGYMPHSGERLYGWSYFGREDPTWVEPREDWKRELLYQRIAVEPGREYEFKAWLLTGDRGSGWGRDSRISLAVDESDSNAFDDFETVDEANMTQWFATRHRWLPVTLRFKARADHVKIGIHFLQWWALETNRLYVDEVSVRALR